MASASWPQPLRTRSPWSRKKKLNARARWHWGGGVAYCDSCAERDEPCSRGEPGRNGKLCPYVEHRLSDEAEFQAWEVLAGASGSLVIAPNGHVVGLDLGAALTLAAARGFDLAAPLLPAAAAGLVDGLNRDRTDVGEPDGD